MNNIPILIVAYNRPKALQRLLSSIAKGIFPKDLSITLIISIDYSGTYECREVARNFNWKYGKKEVIQHESNLGLKAHIIKCGDLSENYDGIIMLEDDLFVSPWFYKYTLEAYGFTKHTKNIAGISLYSYRYNEFADLIFEPIDDGYDNYFMQVPSSWGQFWSKEQWQAFRKYYAIYQIQGASCFEEEYRLPKEVLKWSNHSSWKKFFFKYIVDQNKYIFFPRVSLTTNCGDPGTHFPQEITKLQVPIQMSNRQYSFSALDESYAIYDYTMDISYSSVIKMNSKLEKYVFEVDLYGLKNIEKPGTTYYLSIRKSNRPELGFAYHFYPVDLNIILDIPGDFFCLSKVEHLSSEICQNKHIQLAKSQIKGGEKVMFEEGVLKVKESNSYKVGNAVLSIFRPILKLWQK